MRAAISWITAPGAFLVAFGLVVVLTGLVYWPGLNGPFVFDDRNNLLQPSILITELNAETLKHAALSGESGPLKRPIPLASFALNHYFTGLSTFPFKVTNLAIHLITGLLIYLLTIRLLVTLPSPANNTAPGAGIYKPHGLRWVALAVTAIWLLHPFNLTSVLYVVQRMNSLAGLFTLLGLLLYVIGRHQVINGQRIGLANIVAGIPICTLLAVLSKENGVLLPAFAVLIELIFFRMKAAPSISRSFHWIWYSLVAGPVIVGFGLVIFRPTIFLNLDSYQFRDFTLGERLITETRVLWFYLRLIILPDIRDMGLYHDDLEISRGLFNPPITLLAIAGIAGLIVSAVAVWRKHPVLAFAILWFLLGHSLESTFIPLEIAHDHRNYLPMWGVIMGMVWYLARPYPAFSDRPWLRYGVIALILVMMGFATYARANFWKNEWTLVNHDVLNHPKSARAHTSLAIALHEQGEHEYAHRHFSIAANLNPSDTTTIIRLVHHHYLWKKNIPEELLTELRHRLLAHPFHPVTLWVYEPLIRVTRPDGRIQERILSIYETLVSRQDTPLPRVWRAKAKYNLAFEAYHKGHYRIAMNHIEVAHVLNTHDAGILLLASEVHIQLRNKTRVQELMKKYTELDPSLPPEELKRVENIKLWLERPQLHTRP